MSVKVSVCMTTYNHERYVAQAVESALMQQTNFDFEIVVGEDCSPDGTRAILRELQERHPDKIRLLLRDENIGVGRNFIDTLNACRGEFVALLDGDDYWTSSHKLQKQVDFLRRHADFACCGHEVEHVYENDEPPGLRQKAGDKTIYTLKDVLLGRAYLPTRSMVFRRRLLPEFPPWFKEITLGDWALQVLLADQGRLRFFPDSMAVYRIHDGGVWTRMDHRDRVRAIIRQCGYYRRHFGYRYRRVIQKRIARAYLRLSDLEAEEGNVALARKAFFRGVGLCVITPCIVRRLVERYLRLFVPSIAPTWYRLHRLRRRLFPFARVARPVPNTNEEE